MKILLNQFIVLLITYCRNLEDRNLGDYPGPDILNPDHLLGISRSLMLLKFYFLMSRLPSSIQGRFWEYFLESSAPWKDSEVNL